MLRRHRACQLSIRPGTQSLSTPPVQQTPALCHPSLVRLESPLVPLGASVLPATPPARQEPRRGLALPWTSLAQDHLEDVANPNLIRRRVARPQPTPTRLLGPPTDPTKER